MNRREQAAALMSAFLERTGVTSAAAPRRYLWTDAFAVCNLLGLGRAAEALKLVDQVHHVLGRHREDDVRRGWLSGLGDAEAEAHPTRAGLRIGKPLPERPAGAPLDEAVEWDRDGQYFHYLTRWMHALDQAARATGQTKLNAWALELMETAYAAFVNRDATQMVWKMSVDLTRPLVPSMGHHDPLDGLLTVAQLRWTAGRLAGGVATSRAHDAASGFARLVEGRDWTTTDPLGLGGLLFDAWRADQVVPGTPLVEDLLEAALAGLERWLRRGEVEHPAAHRLAFRELGLAIGFAAVQRLADARGAAASHTLLALAYHARLGQELAAHWADSKHHAVDTWQEHRDINEVMLATALAPEGYLLLARVPDHPAPFPEKARQAPSTRPRRA